MGTTWTLATEVLLGALFWRKGRCDGSCSLRAPSHDGVRKGVHQSGTGSFKCGNKHTSHLRGSDHRHLLGIHSTGHLLRALGCRGVTVWILVG